MCVVLTLAMQCVTRRTCMLAVEASQRVTRAKLGGALAAVILVAIAAILIAYVYKKYV